MVKFLAAVLVVSLATCSSVIPLKAQTNGAPVPVQASGGTGGSPGVFYDRKVMVNGKERSFRLVVPSSVTPQQPAPLVFAFHGMFDSKDLMPLYTFLDFLAYEKRFILVYPNGIGSSWPLLPEWAKDDIALYDALYREITSSYNVDLNRVYLTGMSMGAYFLHMVATQRSEQIAAIASHSGSLGFLQFANPNAANKYSVLVIHGLLDNVIPVQEGRKTRDLYSSWGHRATYLEVPDAGHFWAHQVDVNHKIWDFFNKNPRYSH